MSYPPQPGYPPYGAPPPGYGYFQPQRPPSTVPAYLTAVLFLICGAMTLVFALISWDGTTGNQDILAAVVGVVLSGDLTGNVDFAISASMTVACTTITFAVILLARLGFARWVLAAIGGIVTAYYLYALIYLLTHHAASVIGLVVVALLLWLGATVLAVLPVTGRAMRGGARRYAPPVPAPPYDPGGWYRAP